MLLTEKQFDTGKLTLNYGEGPKAGPTLVLLHGLTGRWEAWYPMLPRLIESWHVYAVDLRGHGKSGHDGDRYHLPDYVEDIVAFLRHGLDESAVVMGHSLGALTALGVAAEASDRVRAAILLDPPLFIRNGSVALRPETEHWFRLTSQMMSSAKTHEDLVEACRKIDPDENQAQMLARMLSGLAPDAPRIAAEDRLLQGFDVEREFKRITVPLLFIQADWDRGGAMRDEDADYIRAQIPAAEIIKIPNAGHQIPMEHGERVVQELQRFVQQKVVS